MYFRRYDLGGKDSADATAFAYAEKKKKPMTNADRIRAMTDEELAWWISDVQYIQRDPAEWEMWLKSPVEVDK